jgi:hypothetical protein
MKIEFIAGSKEVELLVPPPSPAKFYIPEFYKNTESLNINKFSVNDILSGKTAVKMCLPFLDGLTAGYVQETWCDIHVDFTDNQIQYTYPHQVEILSHREVTAFDTESFLNSGFIPFEFIWRRNWIPKLPRGYSLLITHPLSRFDLPFYTLSAIVDADSFYHHPVGNIPFYLKNNFNGVIPAGTPMYQMIPIKRENWEKNDIEFSQDVVKRSSKKSFYGMYKRNFRKNKKYN